MKVATLALLGTATLLSTTSTAQVTPEEADAFVAWATETAIPMPGFDGPNATGTADLSALGDVFERARFVYLGEPDHFIREKYAFRTVFIEHLFRLGWSQICMEMGRADGIRVDRYLATGDERHLGQVGLYSTGGLLARADRSFAAAMRAIGTAGSNGECGLRYFGYDVDTVPGAGFQDALGRLEPLRSIPVIDDLWQLCAEARQTGLTGETPELNGMLEEWELMASDLEPHLKPEQLADLYLDLACLRESGEFVRAVMPILASGVTSYPVDAFARREETMFRQMDAWKERNPGEKLILMGHNMHLGRENGGRMQDHGHTIDLWPCVGAQVAEKEKPEDVFAIWFFYDQGTHNDDMSYQSTEVPSVPGTLEAMLARVPHDTFLLQLRSEDERSDILDRELEFKLNGTSRGFAVLRRKADAIVFTRNASALD